MFAAYYKTLNISVAFISQGKWNCEIKCKVLIVISGTKHRSKWGQNNFKYKTATFKGSQMKRFHSNVFSLPCECKQNEVDASF